ncbi:hypothetical protein ACFS07_07455 [Undibacterium arcticum]
MERLEQEFPNQISRLEYPSNELSAALDRGLIRCRGNWIGYATLHSKYTPLFFASLCSWLSPNQFEYIAVSTDLILTGGTLPKANGNIKPGTIHQLGLEQQRNIPFFDCSKTPSSLNNPCVVVPHLGTPTLTSITSAPSLLS